MPTAGPPTAATSGLRSACIASKKRWLGEPSVSGGRLRKSPTSLPAQKHSGEPWRSTARTSASASAPAIASASPPYISLVRAFFLSSRASSTKAIRLSTRLLIIGGASGSGRRGFGKPVVLELLAQRELGELAGRGVGQLLDED